MVMMVEKSMELLWKKQGISSQEGISTSTATPQRKRFTTAVQLEDVPDEILVEIFLRLPSESIHRLRSVSKKLCKIVGNCLFTNLHMLSVAAASAEVPRLMISIQSDYPKDNTTVLQLMNYDTKTASLRGGNVLNFLGWSDVQIQCVFRNLFCFANKDHPHYCFLFNPLPLTGNGRGEGEVLIIPSIPEHWKPPPFQWYGMGMGCEAKTTALKIKIVCISYGKKGLAAYIYELGSSSSSWRQITSVPPDILSHRTGVSAFGNMFYWLQSVPDCIVSFDFSREEFGTIPRPSLNGGGPFHLVSFHGSLAAVDTKTHSNHIEIWVLTGPNKEWTLNYRIQRDVCFNGPGCGRLKHCGEWEHGLFFVHYHEKWGEWWSDAIFLDLRSSGSIKRVLFPEEFDHRHRCQCLEDAGRLFSFTGTTISLKHYGNLIEAKEGEWCIGKAKTDPLYELQHKGLTYLKCF